MINYEKLLVRLQEKGINTTIIRQKALMSQSTLAKIKMCTGTNEEINNKLEKYKSDHDGKEFMYEVSSKTIEDICQLLQCQPDDIIEWNVDLDPELSFEKRFTNE